MLKRRRWRIQLLEEESPFMPCSTSSSSSSCERRLKSESTAIKENGLPCLFGGGGGEEREGGFFGRVQDFTEEEGKMMACRTPLPPSSQHTYIHKCRYTLRCCFPRTKEQAKRGRDEICAEITFASKGKTGCF